MWEAVEDKADKVRMAKTKGKRTEEKENTEREKERV